MTTIAENDALSSLPRQQQLLLIAGSPVEVTWQGKPLESPLDISFANERRVSISPLVDRKGTVHAPEDREKAEFFGVYDHISKNGLASWRADADTIEEAVVLAKGVFVNQLVAIVDKNKHVYQTATISYLGDVLEGALKIALVPVKSVKSSRNPAVKPAAKSPRTKVVAKAPKGGVADFIDKQIALRKKAKKDMGANPVPKKAKPADPMANVREVKDLKEVGKIATKSAKRTKALLK